MSRRTVLWTVLLAAIAVFAGPQGTAGAMTDERRTAAAMFRAAEDDEPRRPQAETGGELALRDGPSLGPRVVGAVGGGAALSSLGCEADGVPARCKLGTLGGTARGYTMADRLRPAARPAGAAPSRVDDSARRARRGDFDAQGTVRCAQERGQEMGECEASVVRGDGGDATVVVRFPNGFSRSLHFVHGEFVSANATMSGSGSDIDWREEGGRHLIRVDDQRYEVSDDLVLGH